MKKYIQMSTNKPSIGAVFLMFLEIPCDFEKYCQISTLIPSTQSIILHGGRTCLPRFKFLAKFPIGLHVILQIQINKFKIA